MPLPVSPHQPSFSAEELAQARTLAAQHSAPHSHVLRARLTLLLAERPTITHQEAADHVGMAYSTVYKWRRRWAQHVWSCSDAPRPGRKPAFPP